MRILWVKADKLLPVESGGNIRTYHILRYLSSRHELRFYSYYGGGVDEVYERELQRHLPGAVAVCTGKRELSGVARGLDYLARLSAQPPYAAAGPRTAAPLRTGSGRNGRAIRLAGDRRAFQ